MDEKPTQKGDEMEPNPLPATDVRCAAIENPNFPPGDLAILARDSEHPEVRIAVAKKDDLLEETVAFLAEDSDPRVQAAIAGRKDLPEKIARSLAKNPAVEVQTAIAHNTSEKSVLSFLSGALRGRWGNSNHLTSEEMTLLFNPEEPR